MPRLLILLGLLTGVLYSLHLLVKDYQALTKPKLLRFLFKRDASTQNNNPKPNVRWKRILFYDLIECARFFYCDLGTRPANNEVRQGFSLLLALEPRDEDKPSHEVFKMAYQHGKSSVTPGECRKQYPMCPFNASTLFELIQFLLKHRA